MSDQQWSAVDEYFAGLFVAPDDALEQALQSSEAAGLPAISVAPNQGKLLYLLARSIGARRILEIGTLGGYSTIWMARALPSDGALVTLELDAKHADVARANFVRAGLDNVITLREGQALDTLPQLLSEKGGPFDLIFIDADKTNIPDYYTWSLKLARPGSLIIVDNVVRQGHVIDAASTDDSVIGVRRFSEMVANDTRVSATAIQTVGVKGYDGLALLLVNHL